MGKKIARELRDNNYKYRYGTYYGKDNGYDVSLRYDYTSLLYNIYFNVKGPSNIDKLNKELSKIDEYCVARYNDTKLIISHACDRYKYISEYANKVLDVVIKYLIKNNYKNICSKCNKEVKTSLVDIDGSTRFLCNNCYKEYEKKYKLEKENKKKLKENILLGFIGSIIGCIPGFILWIILAYLVINPTVIGLLIMFGSAYFYKWFAHSMKTPGLIISLIVGFLFIILANEISNAMTLYNEYVNQYNINLFDMYKAMPYYIQNSQSIRSTYSQSFFLSIMFGVFGALTNFAVHFAYTAKNKIRKLEVK